MVLTGLTSNIVRQVQIVAELKSVLVIGFFQRVSAETEQCIKSQFFSNVGFLGLFEQ